MDNARYFALKLDPGRHILRSNEKDSEIDQTWEAGKTYYVKITIAAGMMKGHGQMGMVTDKLALKDMQKLRPLDSDHVQADHLAIVDLKTIKIKQNERMGLGTARTGVAEGPFASGPFRRADGGRGGLSNVPHGCRPHALTGRHD